MDWLNCFCAVAGQQRKKAPNSWPSGRQGHKTLPRYSQDGNIMKSEIGHETVDVRDEFRIVDVGTDLKNTECGVTTMICMWFM